MTKPPQTMADLLSRMGLRPGKPMAQHPRPDNPDAPDQATVINDFERAAQYLDEYAAMITGPKHKAVRYLAEKLRKRAKFRVALHRSLMELESAAQARLRSEHNERGEDHSHDHSAERGDGNEEGSAES